MDGRGGPIRKTRLGHMLAPVVVNNKGVDARKDLATRKEAVVRFIWY